MRAGMTTYVWRRALHRGYLLGMSTWSHRAVELFRWWQVARDRRRQARFALRDRREADELERVRTGASRFPTAGGGF